MDSDLKKYISIGSYVIMGISVLTALLFYTGAITENLFLIWTYVLLGIAVVATLAFSLFRIFSSAKSAKRGLILIGATVVLVFIAWLLASPEIPEFIGVEDFSLTPAISRYVGTILIVVYILAIAAAGSMLFATVKGLFK